MDINQFNSLNIQEQVNYINSMLSNQSLDSVCGEIGISRRTISKRFLKSNYSYINKRFILEGEEPKEIPQNIKSETTVINDNSTTPSEVKIKSETPKEIKNKSIPLDVGLQELLNYKDILIEIAQQYKLNGKSETIVINDECKGVPITKGMKTYVDIIIKFDEFCSKNKVFKKQDLLAMALLEYIQKYKRD